MQAVSSRFAKYIPVLSHTILVFAVFVLMFLLSIFLVYLDIVHLLERSPDGYDAGASASKSGISISYTCNSYWRINQTINLSHS